MATVRSPEQAKLLGLAGRQSREIISGGEAGAQQVTFRIVDIPVEKPGDAARTPHVHLTFEECIHVVAGSGIFVTAAAQQPIKAGDTVLVPAGEAHFTRNTGSGALTLMCFFPVADVASGTRELPGF